MKNVVDESMHDDRTSEEGLARTKQPNQLREMSIRRTTRGTQIQTPHGVWRYDRTGKFLSVSHQGWAVRRGLNHRMVESTASGEKGTMFREYRELTEVDKRAVIEEGRLLCAELTVVPNRLPGSSTQTAAQTAASARSMSAEQGLHPKQVSHADGDVHTDLQRILSWSERDLACDEEAFNAVYKPVSILPPDQYQALVVQISQGCSYNRCTFCDFYQGRPFHILSMAEFEAHLRAIRRFFGERLQDRTGIFLADGNALIVPYERLATMIERIRAELPEVQYGHQMSTFMDTFNLDRKSVDQLTTLRKMGLQTVYVGLESGSARVRRFLNKPGTPDEAIEAINLLKQAGYRVGVIVLLGVGGISFAEEHEQMTIQSLREIPFTQGDIIYLSPFVEPHNRAYFERLISAVGGDTPQQGGADIEVAPVTSEGWAAFSQAELVEIYWRWKKILADVAPQVQTTMYSILQHLY